MTAQCAVVKAEAETYPERPPFSPDDIYPEYRYTDTSAENAIYTALRELLRKLELDEANYGTNRWNPLGELIAPGDDVVIKPNFVSESRSGSIDGESIVTHGSVIRPLIDYCLIALNGKGSLVVADAPQADSDFEKIKETTRIQEVLDFVNANSSVKVALLDLREEWAQTQGGLIVNRLKLPGDPKDYTTINLGQRSAFYPIEHQMHKAYGSDYNFKEVRRHHTKGRHEYRVANTILSADVIINVAKLKTHKKAGITGCLKNTIGINGNKNYLPHFRFGSRKQGGDAYAKSSFYQALESTFYESTLGSLARLGPKTIRIMTIPRKMYTFLNSRNVTEHGAGNWHGNDTIWRTIVDLNRILLYSDRSGRICQEPQRKCFAVVDGISGGEGDGPFNVTARACGMLFGGFNPVLLDSVIAATMGFDWRMIPQIVETRETLFPSLDLDQETEGLYYNLNFQPPTGWHSLKAGDSKE
jgi:uncharacterized protein (DUF362 family)